MRARARVGTAIKNKAPMRVALTAAAMIVGATDLWAGEAGMPALPTMSAKVLQVSVRTPDLGICLVRGSVKRRPSGRVYFKTKVCEETEEGQTDAFRLFCPRDDAGTYQIEQKIDGVWTARTVETTDPLGAIIRQACGGAMPRGERPKPPEEPRF